MRCPKIGLLPMYVELYDRSNPEVRPAINAAHAYAVKRLQETGLDVITSDVCRLAEEFETAIKFATASDDVLSAVLSVVVCLSRRS